MPNDPHNLQRFIDAQKQSYAKALSELQAGKKQSHWIWYIFPQTPKAGMGKMAKFYAITTKEEVQAYYDHPLLGKRLIECTQAVLAHADSGLVDIFGTELDAMKFLSCMRLFGHVGGEKSVFLRALEIFEKGEG
jgi:uncharacterized protein (DUF1810 family)